MAQGKSKVQISYMTSDKAQHTDSWHSTIPAQLCTSVQREYNTQRNLNAFVTSTLLMVPINLPQRWEAIVARPYFPSLQLGLFFFFFIFHS